MGKLALAEYGFYRSIIEGASRRRSKSLRRLLTSRLPDILAVLTLVATGGLLLVFIAIAINPSRSFNPYPPPTPGPSTLPTPTVSGARTSSPSPTSPSPTQVAHPVPTPLRPATVAPIPTPDLPFSATVELETSPDCDSVRLAGTVSDREGEPLEEYLIHVWGPGTETIVHSGSAPAYGLSGWEFVIPKTEGSLTSTWYIQLHRHNVYRGHPPLSPIVRVELSGSCQEGLALIHFREREE